MKEPFHRLSEAAASKQTRSVRAFTRLELLAVMGALGMLALVALPSVANTAQRGERLVCVNNLRLLGRGIHLWADDHRDLPPWWINLSEGGTRGGDGGGVQPSPWQSTAWSNLAVMSNELVTPVFLRCPSDFAARTARAFSISPLGGLFHVGYRDAAVSYFLGLDAFIGNPSGVSGLPPGALGQIARPAPLAGDRNLRTDGLSACASGVQIANHVFGTGSTVAWTNAIHGTSGNLLFSDGRVLQTSNKDLARRFLDFENDNGVFHILLPQR